MLRPLRGLWTKKAALYEVIFGAELIVKICAQSEISVAPAKSSKASALPFNTFHTITQQKSIEGQCRGLRGFSWGQQIFRSVRRF